MGGWQEPDVLGSSSRSNNDQEEDEVEPKERYQALLRAVEYNTGGPNSVSPQPPAAAKHSIYGTLCRGRYEPDGVDKSLRAAISNGDLLRVEVDGTTRLARTSEDALRELAVWAAEREDPNRDVVAKANRAMGD